MPDITVAGKIVPEGSIKAKLDEIHGDFSKIVAGDLTLESKYAGKKIFGFSFGDIRANVAGNK